MGDLRSATGRRLTVCLVAAGLAVARLAAAEEEENSWHPDRGQWHLGLEALTDAPLHVGGRISAEGPFGVRVSTSFGALIGPYVALFNAVIVAAGGYDEATAEVIQGALSNSLVWRLHAGWRPLRDHGLYFEVGYGLVTLGGEVTTEDLVIVATGQSGPSGETTGERAYDVGSTLHMIDVEVGWELVFWDRFIVRVGLGAGFTVGAHTEMSPTYSPRFRRLVEEFCAAAAGELDRLYASSVRVPVVSVGLGYRFF